MIWNLGLFLAVAFLAYANGANDNFKRVAALFGSGSNNFPMNPGHGFTANLVTATLITLTGRFGLPLSTTHVSVGAISGIGLVTGQWKPRGILQIMLSWLLTLPLGALIGYYAFLGDG